MNSNELKIVCDSNNIRIDQYLSQKTNYTRTKIVEFLKNGNIFVNDESVNQQSYLLKNNDIIKLKINNLSHMSQSQKRLTKLNKSNEVDKLKIVYEDDDLMIVYKSNDVLVYPTYENEVNTLAHSLQQYFYQTNNKEFGNDLRQGIVHRIDRKTTGLVLIAKKQSIFSILQNMIQDNQIIRKYTCIVHHHFSTNELNRKIKINKEIGISKLGNYKMVVGPNSKNPKEAITIIQPIENISNSFSLVECTMVTGRTHQIRVHMRYINHPIINDPVYGIENKFDNFGQYLMCTNISFDHPITNKLINIKINLDKEFIEKLNSLKHV